MSEIEKLYETLRIQEKEANAITTLSNDIPTPGTVIDGSVYWSESTMLIIAIAVLLFGLIVFLLTSFLLYKRRNPELLLKAFGMPLIIISAIFLIVAGYTEKQIAPVIGLLGTIAGYLLGKESKDDINEISYEEINKKLNLMEEDIKTIIGNTDKEI